MLPVLTDIEEAVDYWHSQDAMTDACKAYVVNFLKQEGLKNREIREALHIKKVYEITHLIRAGSISLSELNLWDKNPNRITLGHIRAIRKLPEIKRDRLLRDLLTKKKTVASYEKIAKGYSEEALDNASFDWLMYANDMSEHIGRPVRITFNKTKGSGEMILKYFNTKEVDDLAAQLGYVKKGDFD